MPRRQPFNAETVAASEIDEEIGRMIDRLTVGEGPAIDASPISDAEKVRQWGQMDPNISDPDMLREHLMQGAVPQELLDPNNPGSLAIVRANPAMAELYADPSPRDERLADMLARLAERPLRLGLLAHLEDDPEAMVKEANRLDALWQKQSGEQEPPTITPQMMGG